MPTPDPIQLRSERVRRLIGDNISPVLRYGIPVVALFVVALFVVAAFIPFPHTDQSILHFFWQSLKR